MGMEYISQPIAEHGTVEAPRRAKKTLGQIAAGLLIMSSFSFLGQSDSPHVNVAKDKEVTFQFKQPDVDEKKTDVKKIVLELISHTWHSPEFNSWVSASTPQPHHSYLSATMSDQAFLACTRGHESHT